MSSKFTFLQPIHHFRKIWDISLCGHHIWKLPSMGEEKKGRRSTLNMPRLPSLLPSFRSGWLPNRCQCQGEPHFQLPTGNTNGRVTHSLTHPHPHPPFSSSEFDIRRVPQDHRVLRFRGPFGSVASSERERGTFWNGKCKRRRE